MDELATFHHYLDLATPYLKRYGYVGVFVGVLLESFGIPAPGQSLVMAGALLAARGDMTIGVLLLSAWSAAVIGDNIGYLIGRVGGRRLVLHHGRYVGLRAAHLQKVERFFQRFGSGIVVVARFFDVLRQLNGIVAGIAGMPWWRFLAFNALGALLWIALWGLGVYYLGHHMGRAIVIFKHIEPYVAVAGALGFVALAIFLFRRRAGRPEP
jgi:membrane protein DedA with SNARE-associated domain